MKLALAVTRARRGYTVPPASNLLVHLRLNMRLLAPLSLNMNYNCRVAR